MNRNLVPILSLILILVSFIGIFLIVFLDKQNVSIAPYVIVLAIILTFLLYGLLYAFKRTNR